MMRRFAIIGLIFSFSAQAQDPAQLHFSLNAVAPIDGVAVVALSDVAQWGPKLGPNSQIIVDAAGNNWRIDFNASATPAQKSAVATAVAAFNPSVVSQNPTVSGCGTSPLVDPSSTNLSGLVTIGTVATGCTVAWAKKMNGAPAYATVPP